MKLILLLSCFYLSIAFGGEASPINPNQKIIDSAVSAVQSLNSAMRSLGEMDVNCQSVSDCKMVDGAYCNSVVTSSKNRYLDEMITLQKEQSKIFDKTPGMPVAICEMFYGFECAAGICIESK